MDPAEGAFIAITTDGRHWLFNALGVQAEKRYEWDFGEPAAGRDNRAFGTEVLHCYLRGGIYEVTLMRSGPESESVTKTVRRIRARGVDS